MLQRHLIGVSHVVIDCCEKLLIKFHSAVLSRWTIVFTCVSKSC